MWLLNHAQSKDIAVPASDSDGKLGSEDDIESKSRRPKRPFWSHPISICLISLLCLAVGFIGGETIQDNGLIAQLTAPRVLECKNAATRKEWRSLSGDEKSEYIGAVRCLLTKPSKMRMKGVLYDDFPYIHSQIGSYCKHCSVFVIFFTWSLYFFHTTNETSLYFTRQISRRRSTDTLRIFFPIHILFSTPVQFSLLTLRDQ
jgi:hypothetical protein